MKCAIITQSEEIINYDNILKILIMEGTYGDVTAYAIIAVPKGVSVDEDNPDKLVQIAVYDSAEKCQIVFNDLIKWLKNGVQPVFDVPVTVQEE